tara:strand:- start:526 stop:975 length:450 start_codon:yes stop_codon:yes gene_type:complete
VPRIAFYRLKARVSDPIWKGPGRFSRALDRCPRALESEDNYRAGRHRTRLDVTGPGILARVWRRLPKDFASGLRTSRALGSVCMEIDVGQRIARPVRLAQSKGRGPRLFNYFDRGNVRCGPARAIGPGKHPRERSQHKEKARSMAGQSF